MGERGGLHGVWGGLSDGAEREGSRNQKHRPTPEEGQVGAGGTSESALSRGGGDAVCPGADEGQGASRGPSRGHSAGCWGPDPWVPGLSLPR